MSVRLTANNSAGIAVNSRSEAIVLTVICSVVASKHEEKQILVE
jgi:hypothetical protein